MVEGLHRVFRESSSQGFGCIWRVLDEGRFGIPYWDPDIPDPDKRRPTGTPGGRVPWSFLRKLLARLLGFRPSVPGLRSLGDPGAA